MAAPNSQFPAGSGSKNPTIIPKKEAEEPDAFSIERDRLAVECKAIKEQYLKEAAIRFKKYETDMRQELLETYFSDKDIFGGNSITKKMLYEYELFMKLFFPTEKLPALDKIFKETGIDGLKAGRCAGTESYADPVDCLKKEAPAKSAANTSTGKGKQGKQLMDSLTS